MRVVRGNLFHFLGDTGVVVHGVTHNKAARGGFAGAVIERFPEVQGVEHFGILPGQVGQVHDRVLALVTQCVYGHAESWLIARSLKELRTSAFFTGPFYLPLIGAGLGGLKREIALTAIVDALAGDDRFTLCLQD